MPFILGQRCISDAENELGLGIVVALTHRTITLFFPSISENRLYTRQNPPITRVIFNIGDTIASQDGYQLVVNEIITTDDGLFNYIGTRLDTTDIVVLAEAMLDSKLTFNKPQDRLYAGQIDRIDRFVLRYHARKYQSEQFSLSYCGLRGIRAQLIPHQLHIAHEVGQRFAPRVLLADEVGLGKTIEAGMILHQQLLTGRAERVLIVVPETLQHQWLVEMLRRFNLSFSLFDNDRYREALLDSDNPFETEQLVICSLQFVQRNKQRLELLCQAQWDLLIVDEAHHLEWNKTAPSKAYQAIEMLSEWSSGILLLTATPEQLGQDSHFARLRLLDPNRFHDYAQFVEEQHKYQPVANAVNELLNNKTLDDNAINSLAELMANQNIEPLLQAINANNLTTSLAARNELISRLIDHHGTSRVLFRNTRRGVSGFPPRKLHPVKLPLPAQYRTAINIARLVNTKKNIEEQARTMLYPEQIFQDLEEDNRSWLAFDPRIEWLLHFLMQHRNNKILVICAHASTAIQIEQTLREREAIRSAVFHEGMSLIERDRAAAYFAAKENGAQVLLCSEIGSEGRNFQFSNQLIMFDLPSNPDLLEQRIGRLDRIGQIQDIQIIVPYLQETAQEILIHWFNEGLDAFEHTCPVGRTIYDSVNEVLLGYLANPFVKEGLDEFIQHCRHQHQELKTNLEIGRDRLLELNSNGNEKGQQLANTIEQQDSSVSLLSFAFELFDIIGVNQDDHSDKLIMLTPSEHMLIPNFPGIPQDGCTITFDRDQALTREDCQFLSWEHPIIRHGLDLILSSDIGCCSIALLKNKALAEGTLLLELIYVVEAQAAKHLQLNRYLPATPLRLLVDQQGNNLANKVSFEHLNKQLSSVNRHTSSKLIGAVKNEVHAMFQSSEAIVIPLAQALIEQAKQNANHTLHAELSRLTALKAINSIVRDDEIEQQEANRQDVLTALVQANWRLDALRLIVVSHQ